MGEISEQFGYVYRDFVTDGIPSSGLHDVDKAEVRGLGPLIEAAIANAGLGALVSVAYATRAELDADLAHDDAAVGIVFADATDANNDLYVKSGASGSGSWVLTSALHDLVSAAAQASVDAAAASASDAAAVVASISGVVETDTLTENMLEFWTSDFFRIGLVNKQGQWQIPLQSLQLDGGFRIEDFETLDVSAPIYATTSDGYLMGKLPDTNATAYATTTDWESIDTDAASFLLTADAYLIGKVLTPASLTAPATELAAARGNAASLSAYLTQTLDANGLPTDAFYRTDRMRSLRMSAAKLQLAGLGLSETIRHDVFLIGDSYIGAPGRWCNRYARWLQATYGDGGPGWVGFGTPAGQPTNANGCARNDIVSVGITAAWTSTYNTANGSPDLSLVTSSTVNDQITVVYTGGGTMTGIDLFYIATAGASVTVDYGGSTTTINLSGTAGTTQKAALPAPPSGNWTLTIKVAASAATPLCGVNIKKSGNGFRVHKLGAYGSRASHWTGVDQAQLAAAWANLVDGSAPATGVSAFIELGTNDQSTATAAATHAANMQTVGLNFRTAAPQADVCLGTPPRNGLYSNPDMGDYAVSVRAVAATNRWTHVNFQPLFGTDYTEYGYTGNTTGRVWFQSDDYHIDGITGAGYGALAYAGAHMTITRV